MKTTLSALTVSTLFAFAVACGGPSNSAITGCPPEKSPGYEEILSQEPPEREPWFYSNVVFANIGGEKYALFHGEVEGGQRSSAMDNSMLEAKANLAEAVQSRILSQFARAWETYGNADVEQREQVTKGLQAIKAEVTVSGLQEFGAHMMQVAKVKDVNFETCEITDRAVVFRAHALVGMPYAQYQDYVERYSNGLRNQAQGPNINATQARLLNEAADALESMSADDADSLNETGSYF